MINNVVTNFSQIINFGKDYNLPLNKKRAIIREYLQMKILDILYLKPISTDIIFVGGTALRLVRNMDRFSEDLDFDLDRATFKQIDQLMKEIEKTMVEENFSINLYRNQTDQRVYYELRFKILLYDLQISQHQDEKLIIKFDFEKFWQAHQKESTLINRYGFLVNAVSINLNQAFVQKMTAYLNRKQTQPRDIYDIIWLVTQGAKLDKKFMKANHLDDNLISQVKTKFSQEKTKLASYKRRLKPFLINENYIHKLELLPQLLTNSA